MQAIADATGRPVEVSGVAEGAALGAALARPFRRRTGLTGRTGLRAALAGAATLALAALA